MRYQICSILRGQLLDHERKQDGPARDRQQRGWDPKRELLVVDQHVRQRGGRIKDNRRKMSTYWDTDAKSSGKKRGGQRHGFVVQRNTIVSQQGNQFEGNQFDESLNWLWSQEEVKKRQRLGDIWMCVAAFFFGPQKMHRSVTTKFLVPDMFLRCDTKNIGNYAI